MFQVTKVSYRTVRDEKRGLTHKIPVATVTLDGIRSTKNAGVNPADKGPEEIRATLERLFNR